MRTWPQGLRYCKAARQSRAMLQDRTSAQAAAPSPSVKQAAAQQTAFPW